jgi:hypothetical protein
MENEKNRENEKINLIFNLETIAIPFLGTLICTIDSEIISGILFLIIFGKLLLPERQNLKNENDAEEIDFF